jgi:hypothetical protein
MKVKEEKGRREGKRERQLERRHDKEMISN